MSQQLRIVVVDQSADGLKALKKALNFEDLAIVHDAGYGPIALTWARNLQPDIVLVALEEPLARPLVTIEQLTQSNPAWTVVGLAPRFEPDSFRKAVLAGARDVIVRSAPAVELHDALLTARRADLARRAVNGHDPMAPAGAIVTAFGVKGGIGKTTLAVNLAVALAQETSSRVALVDLDMPYGDIALLLDIQPEGHVLSALEDGVLDDLERLEAQLTSGPGGIAVLAAPLTPDGERTIDGPQTGALLKGLGALYDYVIADTPPGFNEITAAALDTSTLVLLVTTPELASVRRTQACLKQLQAWDYSSDKVKVVLNRAGFKTGISEQDIVATLGCPIAWRVPDDAAVIQGAALGQPVIVGQPRAALAREIRAIARQLGGLPAASRAARLRSWLRLADGSRPGTVTQREVARVGA